MSDGGIALAAFELAEAAGVGLHMDHQHDDAFLFGEDQGRYLVACNFDAAEALMTAAGQAGVHVASVGKFTGHSLRIGNSEAPMEELSALYRESFAKAVG